MIEILLQCMHVIRSDAELTEIFLAEQIRHGEQNIWHKSWDPLPMDEKVIKIMGQEETSSSPMPHPSIFYYLSYLSALPWTLERYHALGIDIAVFKATMAQLPYLLLQTYDSTGIWEFTGFGWIWRHLSAQLFRIGRLQYFAIPFPRRETFFRNRLSGETCMLCDPALPLRGDGWANGAGGEKSENPWYGTYSEDNLCYQGNLVTRQGKVTEDLVQLKKEEWEVILKEGDWVLELHIPKDGVFDLDTCQKSLSLAKEWYAEIFPAVTVKGLFCHTWLFTPQLEQLLPQNSNILVFQNCFQRMPTPGSSKFLWDFVFGEHISRVTAQGVTSLQKAVIKHLDRGNELFDLMGVLPLTPDSWVFSGWENPFHVQA